MAGAAGCPATLSASAKDLGSPAASEPFVSALDYRNNQLVVGTAAELGCDRLAAERVNWTGDVPPPPGSRVQCKIRCKAAGGRLHPVPPGSDRVEVRFGEPLRARHRPGRSFIEGDRRLGGGMVRANKRR
jgi:tRNA-specific 2-thiouridylase